MFAQPRPNVVATALQVQRLLAVAAVSTAALLPVAQAAGVPGQGTWESTLKGRDLDGNAATIEAYYDTVLDITWLADANFAQTSNYAAADSYGGMIWDEAKNWAAQLNINGVTDWRLPDVKPVNGSSFGYTISSDGSTDFSFNITSTQSELAHLYHVTLGNKSQYDASGNYQLGFEYLGKNAGPFSNFQSSYYWTSMEYAPRTVNAWFFATYTGGQYYNNKGDAIYAWAVHTGDVGVATSAPVPEPQTCALSLAGLAVVFGLRRRAHKNSAENLGESKSEARHPGIQ